MTEPGPELDARALSDGALARRVAAPGGPDPAAEGELCRRFGPRIRLYGVRHLRDGAAAADLVQEVLLVVLDRLRAGAVREPARLASFVLGTCRLAVVDRRRGAARREALLARFGPDLDAAEPARARVDLDRLEACLDGLAPRDRAVLQLTFFAERASDEIGAELALSPANVRVIRHRALARLRGCMGAGDEP